MGHNTRRKVQGLGAAVLLVGILLGCAIGASLLVTSVRENSLRTAQIADVEQELNALHLVQEQVRSGDNVEFQDFEAPYQALLRALETDLAGATPEAVVARRAVRSYVTEMGRRLRGNGVLNGRQALDDASNDGIDDMGSEAVASLRVLRQRAADEADRSYRRSLNGVWLLTMAASVGAVLGIRHLLGTARRVQELEGFRRSDDRIRALMEHAPDIVAVLSTETKAWSYVSPAITDVLGYDVEDFLELDPATVVHPEQAEAAHDYLSALLAGEVDRAKAPFRLRHKAGHWVHTGVTFSDHRSNPDIRGIVVNIRDISAQVELERSLAHQAQHDPLTGLSNRAYFVELVERALARATRLEPVSVVYIDLDGFKEVNDSLGHGAGDEVLMTVAARLLTLTRRRDHVARLGGDEFALLLEGDAPDPVGRRLLDALNEPIDLGAGQVQVGASVGVTTAIDGVTVDELLRDADVAMYDAKSRGKNRVSEFAPEMHQALVDRLELRTSIDAAIVAGEFFMVYQPEISLSTGRLLGFEALIRWRRPDGTLVAPLDFIPLAETTGQVVEIGRWVVAESLGQLAAWHRETGRTDLSMAVNVSGRQLSDEGFTAFVGHQLRRLGVPPVCLTVELTETSLIADQELATRRLTELSDLGVRIAVDDYGSGHASIGYLRDFPIDIVKIDRSFVSALDDKPHEAEAYLRSITDLARGLKLNTIAEGIEHSEQLAALRQLGCDVGQGYHLARPLDAVAAAAFLAQSEAQHAERRAISN